MIETALMAAAPMASTATPEGLIRAQRTETFVLGVISLNAVRKVRGRTERWAGSQPGETETLP